MQKLLFQFAEFGNIERSFDKRNLQEKRKDILPGVDDHNNTRNEDQKMDESNNKTGHGRRRLIKALASGGAIVAAGSLPRHWNKPVVDSVMLPAHAQTSVGQTFFGSDTLVVSAPERGGEVLVKVLDALVPRAQAGNAAIDGDFGVLIEIAVTIVGDGEYEFVMKGTHTFLCPGGVSIGEFSSFHTGTGTDGANQSAPGTDCDGGNAPANLTVEFLSDFLRVFGDIDGANFDFPIFPGGNVPTPSPCVDCPVAETT